jgi:transposase
MRKPRGNHSAAFKARVALEAIRGDKTVAQIAAQHEVHANQGTTWKTQAPESLTAAFSKGAIADDEDWKRREHHQHGRQMKKGRETYEY